MANEEHVRKLQEGVEVWNQWRREHPNIQIDLSGTNFSGAYLKGVDLGEAYLYSANLSGVYLSDANLRDAHLAGVNLSNSKLDKVNLSGTNLIGAHLSNSTLVDANLSNSTLIYANLSGANLYCANLSGAYLRDAFFDAGTTLKGAIFSDGVSTSVSVADVHWGGVNLAVVNWEFVKKLGEEYQARSSHVQSAYQTAVRSNRQLVVMLRDQGLNEEADRFAYRAQVLQRAVWLKRRKPLKYLFSLFLDLLAGYGYRPGRTLLWYFAVIVGFATAYALFGPLPPFPDALVFSLMSFHGRGFFPSLSSETSLHNRVVVVAAIEAVIGLFIEISFIATFTQRFLEGKKWTIPRLSQPS
jgi:Pentapeptide repeats (8 copies)